MPETKQPIPYETLVRLQVVADRAMVFARELEECVEQVDGWINRQLGLDRLGGSDYAEHVWQEFDAARKRMAGVD